MKNFQIAENNEVLLDGKRIGLSVVQRADKTLVYTPECRITGRAYAEHEMPQVRYALSHDKPASGVAGASEFEADIRVLLKQLAAA